MERKQLEGLLRSGLQKGLESLKALKQFNRFIDRDRAAHVKTVIVENAAYTYKQIQNGSRKLFNRFRDGTLGDSAQQYLKDLRRQDWKRLAMDNKPMVAAGACLMLVSGAGVYCFTNIDMALFQPKQVDFVAETQAAQKATVQNEKTLSNLLNVDPARRIGISGFSIFSDGKPVAFAETQVEAYQLLEGLKKAYVPEGAQEVWFLETVEVRQDKLDIVRYEGPLTQEEQIHRIANGTTETRQHVIQQGENLWLIAKKYHISMDTLISANPTIDPEKVKIDQKINLVVPKPLISIACKEVKEYTEAIPYETVYEESASLYKGESTVKQAGIQGQRTVKAEIVRVNGKETERNILNEAVLKQPVKKLVAKGTKNPPPKIGSGSFTRPTARWTVTSRFGKRWGRMHEGIDIGLPIGSTVKAADGGKVTFSGYKNGYGYCVIINHGGGLSTLYGHNSQLLAKVGDSVFKGQAIAKSGNSGRSTGPHLHFEIHKNGVPVNPLNYLK